MPLAIQAACLAEVVLQEVYAELELWEDCLLLFAAFKLLQLIYEIISCARLSLTCM
jgi:hypothetical protein